MGNRCRAPRSFGRGETIYDPWHYVRVLARKPGAPRNGAPFKAWVLPAAMQRVRRPCLLPPDWSGGYTSIFAVQQEEDWNKARPTVAAGGMM